MSFVFGPWGVAARRQGKRSSKRRGRTKRQRGAKGAKPTAMAPLTYLLGSAKLNRCTRKALTGYLNCMKRKKKVVFSM